MKKIFKRVLVGILIAIFMYFFRQGIRSISPWEWVSGTGNTITHRQPFICPNAVGFVYYTASMQDYVISADFKTVGGEREEWFGSTITGVIPWDVFPVPEYFIPAETQDFPELGCTLGEVERFDILPPLGGGGENEDVIHALYTIASVALVGYLISRFWRRAN